MARRSARLSAAAAKKAQTSDQTATDTPASEPYGTGTEAAVDKPSTRSSTRARRQNVPKKVAATRAKAKTPTATAAAARKVSNTRKPKAPNKGRKASTSRYGQKSTAKQLAEEQMETDDVSAEEEAQQDNDDDTSSKVMTAPKRGRQNSKKSVSSEKRQPVASEGRRGRRPAAATKAPTEERMETDNVETDDLPSIHKTPRKKTNRRKSSASRAKELASIVSDLKRWKGRMGDGGGVVVPVLADPPGSPEEEPPARQVPDEDNERVIHLDVFELIAQSLKQTHGELAFPEEFAFFQTHLDEAITDAEIQQIPDHVRRVQMLYVRPLIQHFTSARPELTEFLVRRDELLSRLAYDVNSPLTPRFDLNTFFPAFYFVVQYLVKYYKNWRALSWMEDNDVENDDLLTPFEMLQRNYDCMWRLVMDTTFQVIHKIKINDVLASVTETCTYTTGTVYLFVTLVAKCWYSAIYFDRLDPSGDNVPEVSHSWTFINRLASFLLKKLDGSEILFQLSSLMYPLLIAQADDRLLLSTGEMLSLVRQMAEMSPATCYHHLLCHLFNVAFQAIQYRLVWSQLKKHGQLQSHGDYLERYQTVEHITGWDQVYVKLTEELSLPPVNNNPNEVNTWIAIQPTLVQEVLALLQPLTSKYITDELLNRSEFNQFRYIRRILDFFSSVLPKADVDSNSRLCSIRQMMEQ